MHPVLNRNLFLVKEKVGMFKAANHYDIFDPETGEEIIHCREDRLGPITKLLRFTDYKTMTPFHVDVRTPSGDPILSVRRGISLFLSKVDVLDEEDERIGGFRQKMFSLGGAFRVLGDGDQELCTLKGKWTGWDFRFVAGTTELASVSKKWAGLGKELFTSADNYVLQISDDVPPDNPVRQLIMAAVMCIDMVLKEK
ncbi:MAG: phospholipid scramblase-related protein [Fuerstiella sp.]